MENYARGQHLTNIRHYIDDDESGRFFDRSAYSRMMDDVENGKIGVCIMKDLTRWGRDYLQVGNAMEIFRRNNVRFIAVNNGIDSEKPDTLDCRPVQSVGNRPGTAATIPRPCKSADEVFERSERKEPEVFAALATTAHSR